jgi:hypothetical protein
LELHKKQGYSTINEQPLTPNQQKAQSAGYGPVSKEYADRLAKETNDFQVKKNTKEVDANLYSITRTGKLVPKKGMGSQFCYAIPATSIESIKSIGKTSQEEINEAKRQGVSPWTDIQQFFRNNDMGQCVAKSDQDFNSNIGKYVGRGTKSPLTKTIQSKLANAAEGYANQFMMSLGNNSSKTPIDGVFGKTTAEVVKEYQKDNGIKPADGYVRKNTWDVLKNVEITYNYDVNTKRWEQLPSPDSSSSSLKV